MFFSKIIYFSLASWIHFLAKKGAQKMTKNDPFLTPFDPFWPLFRPFLTTFLTKTSTFPSLWKHKHGSKNDQKNDQKSGIFAINTTFYHFLTTFWTPFWTPFEYLFNKNVYFSLALKTQIRVKKGSKNDQKWPFLDPFWPILGPLFGSLYNSSPDGFSVISWK